MEQLHITHHKGKMTGINSISTSCMLNPYCQERQKHTTLVCYKCYAKKYLRLRPNLREKMAHNTELLTEKLLNDRQIPIINDLYFRLESFGDLINETQAINYLRICELHPKTTFALWTKNLRILENVFTEFKKPENLIINYSSPELNKQTPVDDLPEWVDHVFTVYDKKFAEDNNVPINCGAIHCLSCLKCYEHGGDKYINEILK